MSEYCVKDANPENQKVKRPRVIVLYSIFGPPIGGLIVYLIFLAYTARNEYFLADFRENTLEVLTSLLGGLISFPLLAYLFGGVQALLTGALIKRLSDSDGRFGYLTAFFAAMWVGVCMSFVLSAAYFFSIGYIPVSAIVALGVLGIVASLIVRFLFRKSFRQTGGL